MLFYVLGPLQVHGRDGEIHRLGRGKAATVLATLLLHPNAWVTSAKLSLLDALSGERYRGHPLVRHYARCQGCTPTGLDSPAVRVA